MAKTIDTAAAAAKLGGRPLLDLVTESYRSQVEVRATPGEGVGTRGPDRSSRGRPVRFRQGDLAPCRAADTDRCRGSHSRQGQRQRAHLRLYRWQGSAGLLQSKAVREAGAGG